MKEPDKVRHIVRRLNEEVSGILYLGSEARAVGRVQVLRRGFGSEYGRPDAVVMVKIELELLGTRVKVATPILIEAEDSGLSAAREDWNLFFERDTLEIPMLVVGKPGAPRKTEYWLSQAKVKGEVKFIGLKEEPRSGR